MLKDKFKLLKNESCSFNNKTLFRIVSLKNFGDVKKGQKGGWVENEDNLSQYGECWIYDNAMVFDHAKVLDNAKVKNKAIVFELAIISDSAKIIENAVICGRAKVFDNASVGGNALINSNIRIYQSVKIFGHTRILGGNGIIKGNVSIYDFADITCQDYSQIKDNVKIYGDTKINLPIYLVGNAAIQSNKDYVVIQNFFSSDIQISKNYEK